jgi:hypothetical protein
MPKQCKEKALHRSAWKGDSANFAITQFYEDWGVERVGYLAISSKIHPEFIARCLDTGANLLLAAAQSEEIERRL